MLASNFSRFQIFRQRSSDFPQILSLPTSFMPPLIIRRQSGGLIVPVCNRLLRWRACNSPPIVTHGFQNGARQLLAVPWRSDPLHVFRVREKSPLNEHTGQCRLSNDVKPRPLNAPIHHPAARDHGRVCRRRPRCIFRIPQVAGVYPEIGDSRSLV